MIFDLKRKSMSVPGLEKKKSEMLQMMRIRLAIRWEIC